MVRGPGPSERLGIVVDGGDVVADCLFELAGRAVHSAAGLLLGQLGKKPLDLVDPRRRGWREGNMPARTSGQPSANGWGLWVEQLSITNWTSRSRGTLVSISRRNLRNSRPRWRVLCWAGTMVSESTLAAAPGRRFSSPSITKSPRKWSLHSVYSSHVFWIVVGTKSVSNHPRGDNAIDAYQFTGQCTSGFHSDSASNVWWPSRPPALCRLSLSCLRPVKSATIWGTPDVLWMASSFNCGHKRHVVRAREGRLPV